MPTRKKPTHRRGSARARTRLQGARTRIRETWDAAVEAVTTAEAEAERQLRLLLARNRIKPADARAALVTLRKRVEKERRKAAKQLDARVTALQGRLRHERKNLARVVDEAVKGALVALNIPSRHEVSDLTHKVDELSRKIDSFRRSAPRPRAGRRATVGGATAH
jgi:poly(hydroxyalkanoate) granule associated protein phasin